MFDSHTHILDDRLIEQSEQIVKDMKSDGVEYIVEIGACPDESVMALEFASRHDNVWATAGVHPLYADKYTDDFADWVKKNKDNEKLVAVGECGLDFYHKRTTPELQREVFIKQIKLANEVGLPLVVHSRDACLETYEILKDHKEYLNNGVLLHCFSYSALEEEPYKTLDCYFAFGGAITTRNCDVAREAILNAPLDRLLVETDCPYLSPKPVKNEINQPKYIRHVIEHIAKILGKSSTEVEKITTENAKRFYRVG